MITKEIRWSTDMSKAPKGEMVTKVVEYMRDGKLTKRSSEERVPTRILTLSKCGKVQASHWMLAKYTTSGKLLEGGRWHGFNHGSEPLMWALWPSADELMAEVAGTVAA